MGGVEAATKDQEVSVVHGAPVQQGQDGPVKEALAFGAQALTEALPILGAKRLVRDAGHITEQASGLGLHADHFGARDGQCVGVAVLLQP